MQNITIEEVKERLAAGEHPHLLDVREPSEYAQFNINGTLLPLGKIMGMMLEEIEDWKNDEVIVYCHAGSRSMQACVFLEQAGFTNVKNMVGGMAAWQQKFGTAKP